MQGRNFDRVVTSVYLPITLTLIGLVSVYQNFLWSGRTRILCGYTLFTVATAAMPVVSDYDEDNLILIAQQPSGLVGSVAQPAATICCVRPCKTPHTPLQPCTLPPVCMPCMMQVDALLIKGAPQPPGRGVIAPALHGTTAYAIVLVAVALIAVGDGICQGTMYGEAATMPDKYTQVVVLGASSSGLIISILRVVTKAALPQTGDGLRTATILYFALSALITAACLVTYEYIMPRLDVIAYYRQRLHGAWLTVCIQLCGRCGAV